MANLYDEISELESDACLVSKERPISDRECGFLTFTDIKDVFKSADLLKASGYAITIKAKPETVDKGCELVVEFPSILGLAVLRLLQDNELKPLDTAFVNYAGAEPASILTTKDFDPYIIVRASSVKLVVDKRNHEIVNVSGGGCPDVPYLSARLVGKKLWEAPEPRSIGSTLCGYSLQLAFDAMKRILPCG